MKIGLTYTGSEVKHQNYVRWIRQENKDIEVVKLSVDGGDISDCDALVLSGGVDIHPSFYDGRLDYAEAPIGGWKKDRDEYEKRMLERAWKEGKPVLGVCRGLQLINVVCGGTLIQDLGEQGDEMHQNTPADKEHMVMVMEDSQLFRIAGDGGWINSAHHQAIGILGQGLRANCHTVDGIIEGIEWERPEGRPFMLAVQWHPERMYVNDFVNHAFYMAIRNRFMEEIKKNN